MYHLTRTIVSFFLLLCCSQNTNVAAAENLELHKLSVYSMETKDPLQFEKNKRITCLFLIKGGTAPYTVFWDEKAKGKTNKTTVKTTGLAANNNGSHSFTIKVIDSKGNKASFITNYTIGSSSMMSSSGNSMADLMNSDDDDWGDEDEDEEDVEDPYMKFNAKVYDWTENQSRTVMNTLLPSPVVIGKGKWYYRILHIARERVDEDPLTNLLGLDDNVKIGFQVNYGFTEDIDLHFQRTNGRVLAVDFDKTKQTKMDYYDFIFRYQMLYQRKGDGVDLGFHAGPTLILRNTWEMETSLNGGVLAELNILQDRLRIGGGIVYASLSTYERSIGQGPATKLTPDEYKALEEAGQPTPLPVDEETIAIPLIAKYALTEKQQAFAELIVPIAGYETRAGPGAVIGYRINSNTHEYSFYLGNSANPSYTGAITGGHGRKLEEMNLFGFTISSYF